MSSGHVPVADADLAAAVDPTSTSTPLTAIEPFNAATNYGKGAVLRDSNTAIMARNIFRYQDGKLHANVSKTHALARDEENKRQRRSK